MTQTGSVSLTLASSGVVVVCSVVGRRPNVQRSHANIMFDLKHPRPADPEADESQGPLVALVTHVVMQSGKELRLQSAWQHQLFNEAMLRICHLPVENPISLHQVWELLDEGPETLVLDDRRCGCPGGDDWLNDGVLFLQLLQISWGQVRNPSSFTLYIGL